MMRILAPGFSLVELLVALAILGELAAFTIPKIISAQQNGSYNAKAKEAMAMLAEAHSLYRLESGFTANTKWGDLTPYFNYVNISTTAVIDYTYGATLGGNAFKNCSSTDLCFFLHNGSVLLVDRTHSFSGTNTTNGLLFYFDPDGRVTDGTTNGPGKALQGFLYYNGRILSRSYTLTNTCFDAGGQFCYSAVPTDPPWFSW